MTEIDFVAAFNQRQHQKSEIISDIESVLGATGKEVQGTAIAFSAGVRPFEHLPTIVTTSRNVRMLTEDDGLHQFELTYSYKAEGEKKSDQGRFYVYAHPIYPNVFVAMSIEDGTFVRKGLLPLLRSQFPRFILGHVPHARMKRMMTTFRADNNFSELIITRTTERWRMPEEGQHRRVMPVVSWPDMALDEAFDWLDEHNGWFQSVQFDARREFRTAAKIQVTREGLVRCDHLFEKAFQYFVDPICKIHHEHFNLFSKRSRRDSPHLGVRPLAVTFEEGQFDEVSENHKFLDALRSLSTASVSVIHGNPYLHAMVTDYLDGSAFDLWIVDSRELVIVPQLYCSVGAIQRLINHVFDSYAEGDISNFREAK